MRKFWMRQTLIMPLGEIPLCPVFGAPPLNIFPLTTSEVSVGESVLLEGCTAFVAYFVLVSVWELKGCLKPEVVSQFSFTVDVS